MEISNIVNFATTLSNNRISEEVGIAVLKKALDAGTTAALMLIEAIPPAPSLPSNLGQNIDISV
jgi:hypothetical protein